MKIVPRLSDAALDQLVEAARQQATLAECDAHAKRMLFADLALRAVRRRLLAAGIVAGDELTIDGAEVKFVGETCLPDGPRLMVSYRNNRGEWGPPREMPLETVGRMKKRTSNS